MIRSGLRKVASKVKRRITKRLHPEPPVRAGTVSAPAASAASPAPAVSQVAPPASPLAPEPVQAAPIESQAASGAATSSDLPDLTREVVWALFEDMVRPALQADGGDIELVKVDDNDVYVRLVGACRGCPSSTITMNQGIERLLREEFPQFGHLIQVDAGPGHEAAMAAAAP